jgi:hypothetical protein
MSMKHYDQAVELIKQRGLASRFVGPKSEEAVAKAEAALGVRFPPTYRRFCLEYGAGLCFAGVLEPKDLALPCARVHYVGGYHKPGQPPKPGTPYATLDVVETTLRFLKRKSIVEVPKIDMWSNGPRSTKHLLVDAWLIMFTGAYGLVVTDKTGKSEAKCYYLCPAAKRLPPSNVWAGNRAKSNRVSRPKQEYDKYPNCHDDPREGDFGRCFLRSLLQLDA